MIYCPICMGPHVLVSHSVITVYRDETAVVRGGTCKDCGCQFKIIKEGNLH
jgi:transcriptional regulator NrdR family protein